MNINELSKECHKNAVEISGFNGYYIDIYGNIFSSYMKMKKMKPQINRDGYYYINLKQNNKIKRIAIHRLLALTFIPNPKNKGDVNHIDGNKLNNSIENLEWNTRKENINHAFKNGLSCTKGHVSGEKNGRCKLKEYQVKEIISKIGKIHINEIIKEYNISKSLVYAIKNKKAWNHIER